MLRRILWLLSSSLFLLCLLTPSLVFAQSRTTVLSSKQVTATLCPQIPANIDSTMMTLSDTDLATYGLPSHAAVAQDPTLWKHVIDGSHRSCKAAVPSHIHYRASLPESGTIQPPTVQPQIAQRPNTIGDGCNATPGSQCQDGVWAGNLALSAGRGKYHSSSIYVNVPNVNLSNSSAEVAFWAGVGGDAYITSNPVVVQSAIVVSIVAGQRYVETDIDVEPALSGAYNLPLCKGLSVNDQIYLYAESNLNNSGYDYFYIKDEADGCSNSCYVGTNNTNPPGPHCSFQGGSSLNSDSASGECIAERVNGTEYGSGDPVIEFNAPGHQEQVVNCEIAGVLIGLQAHNYMVLVNGVGGGQLLVGVGPITGNGNYNFQWTQSS